MSRDVTDRGANGLLASLPKKEQRRLWRTLEVAPLGAHDVLVEPGRPIESLYFPKGGTLISLILGLADGRSFEAGLVGSEGVVGVEVFLGGGASPFSATVLAGGESLRMQAEDFRAEVRDGGPLTALLRRYVQFLLLQFSLLAGCHRFHLLEQHFSSSLLRMQDRTGCDDLAITHQVFARRVGVRRVGITQVARKLQRAGLIRYRWGKVTILDRPGLEARACACHQQIERACRHLLGPPGPNRAG
jgi:CRP-like cAMP-binding protein